MGEKELTETLNHRLLKLLGVKYLNKVGCRLVTTEVWIIGDWSIEDQLTKDTDNKRVIDVVGLYDQPLYQVVKTYPNGYEEKKRVGTKQVSKGIEVKVSRQDFKNGYVCTGLNYHYLLTPKDMVSLREIPKHVGLLEYDPKIHPADCYIKIRRRPTFQQTRQTTQGYLTFRITDRQHGAYMDIVRDQITQLTNLKK